MYLQMGNMKDILEMSFHDFKGVINQMIYESHPPTNRFRKLSKNQKGMIQKLKDLKR